MLGYIRGERYSLAVDAGNSRRHVEKFYAALDAAELLLLCEKNEKSLHEE